MAISAQRKAGIELTVGSKGMDPGLRDAKRKLRLFQREQEKAAKDAERASERSKKLWRDRAGGAGSGVLGAVKGVGFGMAAAAGFDLAGGLGSLVQNVFDVEKELTRFGIDAQLTAGELNAFRDATRLVSDQTGQSQLSIVEAAHAYQILTGDARGAVSQVKLFAEVANASGASMHDIAEVGASLNKNLGMDPANFRAGFDILLTMGHKASVELRDFAGEMSTLNPLFKDFGSKPAQEKLAEMAAILEVTKYNFANAAEASTGFKAAMAQISKTKVADKLANAGVNVWEIDPKTKTHVKRDYLDILKDIHDKVKDRKQLSDILGGRQESYRAITAELDHYDELLRLKNESNSSDQVAKDNARWMESTSGRLAKAWEIVKNSVAAAFTPDRIEKFVGAITTAGDAIAKLIGYLSDLPEKLAMEEKRQKTGINSDTAIDIQNEEHDKYLDATPAEKKARAMELRRMARETQHDSGAIDEDAGGWEGKRKWMLAAQASGYRNAADALAAEATPNMHGDDMHSFRTRPIDAKGYMEASSHVREIAQAFTASVTKALAQAGITVVLKADGSAIAKTSGNATIHGRRPGGHR